MKHFTKSFLVLLAALFSFSMAFAETGTETEANQKNGNKNTTAEGRSYTIDGTYIAGTGSSSASPMTSKGLKFRTAQNGGILEFTVREGYTITKLYMAAIGNYTADNPDLPYVKVSKVEVDDTEVEFEGGDFPEKGASAAGELTIDNIAATQKIVLYFDNSNASAGTQLNASWSIDWSRPDATQPTITVTPKTLALVPGASSKLSVYVDPASFTTKWVSSDETVATVTEDGTVTAVAPGIATISNQWDNDASVAGAAVVTVAEFDPSAYTAISYDFTAMGDVSLTLSDEAAGAIWNEGNNKANDVFFCTNEGLENIAVQAALSGGKGWSIIDGQGLVLASGAGRCAAVGNLKAGQIVEIIYTGNGFYTGSREDAVRKDDGALKTALNEGVGRAIYKMDEDGLLGFELEKGKAVTQIIIYSSNSGVEDVYTVAGNSTAIFGTEWDAANTANDMVKGDDGIYTKVYEGVELANDFIVEYKIVKNHSWDESWGDNGNNATYKVWEGDGKYDVTFTFNPETKAVACAMTKAIEIAPIIPEGTYYVMNANAGTLINAEAKLDAKGAPLTIVFNAETNTYNIQGGGAFDAYAFTINQAIEGMSGFYTISTMGQYLTANADGATISLGTDATADAAVWIFLQQAYWEDIVNSTYTIAGTKNLTGTENDWDIVEANQMVLNEETGLFEKTFKCIAINAENQPEFKVVQTNMESETTWYPAGANWVITTDFVGGEGIYDITITFDPSDFKEIGVIAQPTPTFDFENNNGNWPIGEGANWEAGVLNEPITMDGITLTAIQGEAQNQVRYMTNSSKGNHLQIFKNNSIKLTAPEGKSIVKVEVTMQTNSFDLTPSTGEVVDNVWTGNAKEVTFTNTKGTRYVYAINVTVEDAAADNNYYILGDFWGWDNPQKMEATETENVYVLVIDATVEAKKYEYKLRQGDNWDGYQLPAESGNYNFVFGTEEYPAGEYTLTFTANVAEHTLTLDVVNKTADGINSIAAEAQKGNVYNLAGQKVMKTQKGLYIVNGRKVVIK